MAESRQTSMTPFAELAAECWRDDGGDGWEEVDRIEREAPENLPAVIRALTSSAPEGSLSYIGVYILENLAERAKREGRDDTAIEVLIAAQLAPADTFEILAGPYPEYLDRWGVRARFAATFTAAQLDALLDWGGRRGRRLVLDGASFRLAAESAWFKS